MLFYVSHSWSSPSSDNYVSVSWINKVSVGCESTVKTVAHWLGYMIKDTCQNRCLYLYRWGKTPKKTSPRKPVPTGDRTRARSVTSAHATTCSTAVDGSACRGTNLPSGRLLYIHTITLLLLLIKLIYDLYKNIHQQGG